MGPEAWLTTGRSIQRRVAAAWDRLNGQNGLLTSVWSALCQLRAMAPSAIKVTCAPFRRSGENAGRPMM